MMLQRFALERGLHDVSLKPKVHGKAGSAQTLVSTAIADAQSNRRGSNNKFSSKYIILDTDWLSAAESENTRMKNRPRRMGLN